ncbi:MAG: hydantoinase B/oxoprolinase family protein, partial [Rhodospirillales bacterium]
MQKPVAVKCDPITMEVVRSRLDAIANEMESTLLKSAFSTVVKEAADASAAIFDRQGNAIAQAIAIPSHLGMLGIAVRRMIMRHPVEKMLPGDVYIHNDPYDAGTHLPDITILAPVFFEDSIVALSACMAHQQDIGGKTPGSTAADSTEIFAEGLRISAMRLFDNGRPIEQVFQFLRANTRLPDTLIGDINAQIACVNIGIRRLIEMFSEFGTDTCLGAMEELLDHAERLARAEVLTIPDGDYTFFDYLDGDGINAHSPVKVQATIRKRGSNIHYDFTGTDPEVPGAVNCVPSPRQAMEYFMLKAVCKSDLPNNDGVSRLFTSFAPEGTLVNPRMPRAVATRGVTM